MRYRLAGYMGGLDIVSFSIYNMRVGKRFNFKEFVWDSGNKNKNWLKHQVSNKESEEAFFDEMRKIFQDKFHSEKEDRFILLGKTEKGRSLYTVFTKRNSKIRIISSRDMDKKERRFYEEKTDSA